MPAIFYHNWASSSSWRVRWLLAIKQVQHQTVDIDLRGGQQWDPAFVKKSARGMVPALALDDGRILTESVAIFEYLEETVPDPPLYPRDPWERFRVRQLVEVVNSGVQPLQNLRVLERHAPIDAGDQDQERTGRAREERKRWAAQWNALGLSAFEQLLGEIAAERGGAGRHCVGDTLTAADLFLVPQVASARRFGVDVTQLPRVVAAEQAALATPHAEAAKSR
jgi:maleylacetoacetate isomerase